MSGDALDVFIAYTQEDETLREELEEQLLGLEREGLIRSRNDRKIAAGDELRAGVDEDLTTADLVLVMVSAPFLESSYCDGAEIKHALERHAWGQGKFIPIIARPCDWSATPFAHLETLPQGVGPVTEWHDREGAWEDVGQGIRDVARRLIKARLESTAAYRIAVRSPIREEESPPAAPPEEIAEPAATARWAVLGGFAMVLTALVGTLYLVLWRPQRAEVDGPLAAAVGIDRPAVEARQDSPARVSRPSSVVEDSPSSEPASSESASSEPASSEAEVDSNPPTSAQDPSPSDDLSPVESSANESNAAEDASLTVEQTTDEAPEEPQVDISDSEALADPANDGRELKDFRRSLGILAAPGAADESGCLAVLVDDDRALTSAACTESATVMVMGGNALAATRDEIFDLEPGRTSQVGGVDVVHLLQGLGESYGFVETMSEENFDHEDLDAYYLEASRIESATCAGVERLSAIEVEGRAYVENDTFERYSLMIEEAADEAISVAGAQWASLLRDVLDSAEEGLAGVVCEFSNRPSGNLVFSDGERAVGIGYPCEPLDRLEPEVRDSLPETIGQLDLDCIASLGEM